MIIGILAAVGIPAAAHFIRLAEFRKNEENAKTAYLAAESALTWYRTSGEWETFRAQVLENGLPNHTFGENDEKNGRIYAITLSGSQAETASGSQDQVKALLEHGGYSNDFLDAAVTIEIDTETGRVYSAFYATHALGMSYEGTDTDGVLNISAAGENRAYENRRERLLGYYSTEDVANVVELKPVRLKVSTINLVNSETLSLNWTSNSRHEDLDVKFLISFYNNRDHSELFSMEIDRKSLPPEAAAAGLARLKLENAASGELGEWVFPLSYQAVGGGNGRFTLVLDGMMTASLMEAIEAKGGAGSTIAQEYSTSITRLGNLIPSLQAPQDIYAQIEVQPTYGIADGSFTEYKPSGPVRSNVENTLFVKGSVDEGGALEAQIGRFRHLSNIRYYDTEKQATFTLFGRNLDWASAGTGMYDAAPGNGGTGLSVLTWKGTAQDDGTLDFPSIEVLAAVHTLEGKGASTLVSNLCLGTASMPDDALVEKLYGGEGSAAVEEKRTHYLGLFGEVEGTVRSLMLQDPTLTLVSEEGQMEAVKGFDGLYGVGIVCGRSEGRLQDVSVRATQGNQAQTMTVRLPMRETSTGAADPKPAGIGGLVGVLAKKDGDGNLLPLTDPVQNVAKNLSMQGTLSAVLPAPSAGTKPAQERAEEYQYGIGGIFGYGAMGGDVRVENCRNEAYVTGNLFSGGIGGFLTGDFVSLTGTEGDGTSHASITDCSNDGLVLCALGYEHEDEENELEGRYFGGILGFGNTVQISDCASASGRFGNYSYSDDVDRKEEVLLGQYVGGIIGYGNNSQLAGCSTRKGGYILGSDYVGGIAGGLSNDARVAITGTAGVAVTTNAGYVIGNRYVGGIVGKNDGDAPTTITNCVNNGVAAGYDRYIGGIVGYNGEMGRLKDCASYLSDYDGTLFSMIVDKWQATGDCAGGLAGYNNGEIIFTQDSEKITVKSVSSIVVGEDYVGGVIGFNDIKGKLDVHYTLIGGRIHAYGNAAGGCIGLNASTEILDRELSVRPSSVTGVYYVGGCIGANVVALAGDTVMDGFRADNALGSVTGTAFTGGVIGYQRTYTPEQLAGFAGTEAESGLLDYLDAAGATENVAAAVGEGVLGRQPGVPDTAAGTGGEALLPTLGAGNVPTEVMRSANGYTLTIGNRKNGKDNVNNDNNNIPVSADFYVGGIVGYCERGSRLILKYCKNAGNLSRQAGFASGVLLKTYLASGEVNADVSDLGDMDISVSIGGGIIGANLDNQVIDGCVNTGIMNGFIGLGGIVGFNAGGVFNCHLNDNFGNAGLDYIGGIAGLNVHAQDASMGNAGAGLEKVDGYKSLYQYESGMISQCTTAEKKNISGGSYVGGIVGYNMAQACVDSNINRANVTAAGDYAGGIAGANRGRVLVSSSVGNTGECMITGKSGTGIGGIVGYNRLGGEIDVAGEGYISEVVAVGPAVSVDGKQKVGGIVGINEGLLGTSAGTGTIYLVCQAKMVHATEGYAGGIIGEARTVPSSGEGDGASTSAAKISYAINRSGSVAADSGPAGGIVAVCEQGFILQDCRNEGDVRSDHGYAGGIAAENKGQILRCSVGKKDGTQKITVRSQDVEEIGAICGVNYGAVWSSAPEGNVILAGSARAVGGISGRNAAGGVIEKEIGQDNGNYVFTYMPEIRSSAAELVVGGAAGINERSDGGKDAARVAQMTAFGLKFTEFSNYKYLGGIVGENQNDAEVIACESVGGEIRQKDGAVPGNCYGGIAGRNNGILKECDVNGISIEVQGVYTATSTSSAQEKEAFSSHVGGIAGKNEEDGEIDGCLIQGNGSRIEAASGMAGGVAGYNKGSIRLSGDAATAGLMKENGTELNDVQTLIQKADTAGIKADGSYVNWSGSRIEDQSYAGGGRVNAGRSLSMTMTSNGNLGGITAYNAPTGSVNHCATGNWYLNNKSAAIGVGTGGIIGMNESERDLSFLLNQAFVGREIASGDTNRFAGGIIGNQNNITSSAWSIRNCVNYGTVYCRNTHYSGGILGQWTGRGGTIEKCYNYGNMQTTYRGDWSGAAGGIVAQLYHAYEKNEYSIVGCGNYGNIYGRTGRSTADAASDSAGILGNVTTYLVNNASNAQQYTINVLDCVNGAGVEIYSNSMASGIVGFFSSDNPPNDAYNPLKISTSGIQLNIERCRNYAGVLVGNNFTAGIFGERYGIDGAKNTSLKYCFSMDRQSAYYNNYDKKPYPIVSYVNGSNKNEKSVSYINSGDAGKVYNYFLSENSGTAGFQSGTATFNVTADSTIERVNTRWIYSFIKNGTRYFVHLNNGNGYRVSRLSIDGSAVRNGNTKVGDVLFTIEDASDANRYDRVTNVVAKGSEFDKYVREFCFAQAGMLLAPESVALIREKDSELTIQVNVSGIVSDEVVYVAVAYRKGADGTQERIDLKELGAEGGIQADTKEPGAFIFDAEKFTFRLSEAELAKGGEIFIRLKARSLETDLESAEVDSNVVSLSNTLPDPKLRIELTGSSGNYQYRFRLDNREDYGQGETLIYVKLMDGTQLSFTADGEATYSLKSDSLQQLVVWAAGMDADGKPNGLSSSEVSVPVYLPAYTPEIALRGTGQTATASAVVTGTSLEDLRIAVTLQGQGGKVTTPPVYRVDLIGTWNDEEGEHKETVFQSADILTSADGSATASFADLPAYIADASDLQVRVWYAQSGLGPVYSYYDVAAGETPNIHNLIIEEAEDGTQIKEWQYAYSPVLAGNTFANYRWTSNVLLRWLSPPVLMKLEEGKSLPPETNADTGGLEYTFKWDEGPGEYDPAKDTYLVSLYGISKDESGNVTGRVSLLTGREVKGNSITVDAENWTYQEVELTVSRKGNAAGTPCEIGLPSTETYRVKRRLPRPAQPRITNPDINELKYEVEWEAVEPEAKWDAADPIYGCDFYDIYVQPYEADGVSLGEVKLIATKPVWDEAGAPTSENGVYKQTIDLEHVEDVENGYAGKRVLIYIKAMAREEDLAYVHSVDGVTYALDVPDRIREPKVTWEKDWEHEKDENKAKTVDSFQDSGLKVTVNADKDSIPPGGSSYLTKAYVFESKEQAEAAADAIEGGAVKDVDGLLATYPALNDQEELNPAQMDVEGTDRYSHALSGLSAEYAGKYILFYARISSGEGNVSSSWVANPDIWQLPYVILPTPDVSVDSAKQDVEVTLIYNPDLSDGGDSGMKKEEETEENTANSDEEEENGGEMTEPSDEENTSGQEPDREETESDTTDQEEDGPNTNSSESEGSDSKEEESSGTGGNPDGTERPGEGENPSETETVTDDNGNPSGSEQASDGNEGSSAPEEPTGGNGDSSGSEAMADGNGGSSDSKATLDGNGGSSDTEAAADRNGRSSGVEAPADGNGGSSSSKATLDGNGRSSGSEAAAIARGGRPAVNTASSPTERIVAAGAYRRKTITVSAPRREAGTERTVLSLTAEGEKKEPSHEARAGEIEEKKTWTAEHTALRWDSVAYADSYYIMFTTKEGDSMEFRIVEEGGAVSVYRRSGSGWDEISGQDGRFALSGYQREISGQYEKETDLKVPYKVELQGSLEVSGQGEQFSYTLILPDAASLTPPDGGNSISGDELHFTKTVSICSDVKENEGTPGSQAYIRSKPFEVTFQ